VPHTDYSQPSAPAWTGVFRWPNLPDNEPSTPGYVEGTFDFPSLLSRLSRHHVRASGERENSDVVRRRAPGEPENSNVIPQQAPDAKSATMAASQAYQRFIFTLDWTNFIVRDEEKFIGSGGFAEVDEGKWINIPPEEMSILPRVVVKRLRIPSAWREETPEARRTIRQVTDFPCRATGFFSDPISAVS
jgi:hypothetical protein